MAAIRFTLNGKSTTVDVIPQTPMLWVLRDTLGMTGTKFGCGMALCGACTVHLNGQPMRACVTPVSMAAGKTVTTIEGLSPDSSHPIQRAWIEEDVPQCGYCQSGQIMTAAALLAKSAPPHRRRYRRIHAQQYLPLRRLSIHPQRHSPRRQVSGGSHGRQKMSAAPVQTKFNRRNFLRAGRRGRRPLRRLPSARKFAPRSRGNHAQAQRLGPRGHGQ